MEVVASLGLWIKHCRRAHALTQDELAAHIGIATITLRKIEADERRPSRHIAERLADHFQLTATERTAFLRAVRAEIAPDQLALPIVRPPPLPARKPSLLAPAAPLSPLEPPPWPSGTLTFLGCAAVLPAPHGIADVPGLVAQLRPVFACIADALIQAGGIVFQRSNTHCLAAFAQPSAAIRAALRAHGALHQLNGDTHSPIAVRMALHTGDAVPDQDEYLGPTTTLTELLRDLAHGDQVLLSETTAALVHPHLPPDVTLRDLGPYRLGTLQSAIRLWQLLAPELPTTLPPSTGRLPAPTQLPSYPTPLLGREHTLATIAAQLRHPQIRLLTLTGPGGSGKTRLAVQAASTLVDAFADGVTFVDLTAMRDPTLFSSVLVEACGIKINTGQSLERALRTTLAAQERLLVLDNCEHVLGIAPLLAELLLYAPRLTILATSRVLLQLNGEHELHVPPLPVPDPTNLPPLRELRAFPAIQLFVQHAQALVPTFGLDAENAGVIAAICARLDGLPLAIQLAARRIKLLPPATLLERLTHRLPVLTGGGRDLPERQQTLRRTIDWSYSLLSADEQVLFRRLSVFVGECTLEAAEAVGGEGDLDVLMALGGLIDKSLLEREAGVDGALRFRMLETIREYAREQLIAAGEDALMHTRHAAYYAGWVAALNTDTEQPTDWVPLVAVEHPNLVAALEWALRVQDGPTVMHLCAHTYMFWMLRGMHREGLRWCKAALEAGETAPPHVWQGAGSFACLLREYATAEAYMQRALAIARQQGDLATTASLLHNLGTMAAHQQQLEQAKAYYTESLLVQQQLPRPFALTLSNLAEIALEEHDEQRAEELLHQALDLTERSGDLRVHVFVLDNLAYQRLLTENAIAAVPPLIEACRICQVLGGHDHIPGLLWGTVACLEAHGDSLGAAHLLTAAETLGPQWLQYRLPREVGYLTAIHARLHAALNPATLAAAQAEGRALSPMAAIQLARSALEHLATPRLPGEAP